MKIATWNVNSVKARLGASARLARRGEARRAVPAGDQMPRRGISRRSRCGAPAITSRRLGQRAYNGVAHPVARAGARRGARPARRRERRAGALSRGDLRRRARRLDLSAQRQSGRHRQIPLQARLDAPARGARARAARQRAALRARRRLQRLPDRRRRVRSRGLARGRAVPAGIARRASACCSISGYVDAFRVFHAEPHRYSFWDYQAGPLDARRRACASTICC